MNYNYHLDEAKKLIQKWQLSGSIEFLSEYEKTLFTEALAEKLKDTYDEGFDSGSSP